MLKQLSNGIVIKGLIAVMLILGTYTLTKIYMLKSEVKSKEEYISELTTKLAVMEINYNTKTKELETLQAWVEKDKIDYEAKLKEYNKKQLTKPNIKYIEVESNECKDVLLQLDDIREKGY